MSNLTTYLTQVEKAFSKLREAHNIELEAMKLLYEAKSNLVTESIKSATSAQVTLEEKNKKAVKEFVNKVFEEKNKTTGEFASKAFDEEAKGNIIVNSSIGPTEDTPSILLNKITTKKPKTSKSKSSTKATVDPVITKVTSLESSTPKTNLTFEQSLKNDESARGKVIIDETGEMLDSILNNKDIKKECHTLPTGDKVVKIPTSELQKINKQRLVFCRDCHKQIRDTPHGIGNNLFVCDSCFSKRNSK